jgi:hypothetical protein
MIDRVKIIVLLAIFLSISDYSFAQGLNKGEKGATECQPVYGHYWRSYKWGWYGARRVVRTPVEAKEIIEQVFITHGGIRIGKILDKPRFYVAEIVNGKGFVIDLLLIDKRTGRIRSMF